MASIGLTDREMDLIRGVLKRHGEITGAVMFGSRAKGIASPASDIDLALEGIEDELAAEAIAADLSVTFEYATDEIRLPIRQTESRHQSVLGAMKQPCSASIATE